MKRFILISLLCGCATDPMTYPMTYSQWKREQVKREAIKGVTF